MSMRSAIHAMVVPLLIGAATAAHAGDAQIQNAVANKSSASQCGNKNASTCPLNSPGASTVRNARQNHIHTASDYRVATDGGSGCAPCGSGGGPAPGTDPSGLGLLSLERIHRLREVSFRSSFGPGVFSNWDVHIALNAYNAESGAIKCVDMFDPHGELERFEATTADAAILTAPRQSRIARIELFTAYDAVTDAGVLLGAGATYHDAAYAVARGFDGSRQVFELIDTERDPSMVHERFKVGSPLPEQQALPAGQVVGLAIFASANSGNLRFDNLTALAGDGSVAYCETFPSGPGDASARAQIEGWTGVRTERLDPQLCAIYGPGSATAATPVGSFPQGGDSGFLLWSPKLAENKFIFTREANFPTSQLATLRIETRNSNTTNQFRLAVCVDGVWYVTPSRTHTLDGNTWQTQTFAVAGNTWQKLPVDLVVDNAERGGRLIRSVDRRGYGTTLTYQHAAAAIPAVGDQLWQIDRVTDAYGNQAVFQYLPTQVAGQWVVSAITAPNGQQIAYGYADGKLTQVQLPDGTASTFTYGFDAPRGLVTLAYDDAAAEPTHRRKTVWLSTGYSLSDPTAQVSLAAGGLVPHAMQAVRMIVDPTGALAYANLFNGDKIFAFEGGGKLKIIDMSGVNVQVGYAATWSVRPGAPAAFTGADIVYTMEPNPEIYAYASGFDREAGLETATTSGGITTQRLGWTGSGKPYGLRHPDGSVERSTYGPFDLITTSTDTRGRREAWTYDAVGNQLTHTRAVGTAEAATWRKSWYPATDPNRHLLASDIDANGNATDRIYDAQHRLIAIVQPADAPGGPRATTQYAYDSAGRLASVTDSAGRVVTFAYDVRSRLISTTYPDGSTETTTYGSGTQANLVISRTDRNGNLTTFVYDARDRLVQTTVAAGSATPSVETLTYYPGTTIVVTRTRDGDTTTNVLDYRHRQIATVRNTAGAAALTEWTVYDSQQRPSLRIDAYGRRTFQAYDNRNRTVRTVRELMPGAVPTTGSATNAVLMSLTRPATANPGYVITDRVLDTEGQVLREVDGRGTATDHVYDAQGRTIQEIAASGFFAGSATRAHIEGGTLFTAITDPTIARQRTWTYDAQGNAVLERHPRWFDPSDSAGYHQAATAMTYTGRNLVATTTEAPGTPIAATTQYTYTGTRKTATMTDALGRTTTNTYGICCDRLVRVTDPLGFSTEFTYDPHGNRTAVRDPNGLIATTAYDGRHRPISTTNAAGETTTFAYLDDASVLAAAAGLGLGTGANGSAVLTTNPAGETMVAIRDGLGRAVRQIDGLGHATTTSYDAVVAGLVVTSQTDALGHTTAQHADGAGRIRTMVDALGFAVTSAYDANGNRTRVRDANGIGDDCVFDRADRLITCTGTDNAVTAMVYDAAGHVRSDQDALGASTTHLYDARGRKTSTTDRIAATTTFTYDLVGNLLSITDAEGGVTRYGYDARNLLISEEFPPGLTTPKRSTDPGAIPPSPGSAGNVNLRTYTYDAGRRLASRLDQRGIVTTYTYDPANRLASRGYPDALSDSFTYDPASRLTGAVSQRYGTTVSRVYDAAGRLTSETQGVNAQTATVSYAYDADNRQTSLTYPNGQVMATTYTDRNQIATRSFAGQNVISRSYDLGGRLIQTDYANGVIETRTYATGDNLVATINATGPQGPVTGFAYTYDANKRKLLERDTVMATWSQRFGYDAEGRLTAWRQGVADVSGQIITPASEQGWTLTPVGDWQQTVKDGVTENRTATKVHEIATIDRGAGLIPLAYDPAGNLSRDDTGQEFTWDPENRLRLALTKDHGWASYAYDALGRRLAKTVEGKTTVFVHDGARAIQEVDARPAVDAAAAASDGDLANAALAPSKAGGILSNVQLRVNFQPTSSPVPPGYVADKGRAFGVRTNGRSYGWSSDRTGTARQRQVLAEPAPDSFVGMVGGAPATAASWSIAVPNGTYPVAIVAGDVASMESTNHLVVNGQILTDPDPGGAGSEYEHGDLDGWARTVSVTDGKITISAGVGAVLPKLVLVEIGQAGASAGVAEEARLEARLNSWNEGIGGGQQIVVGGVRSYVHGDYVDEVVGYRNGTDRYYINSNHLYSSAVLVNDIGNTAERFYYNAYGDLITMAPSGQIRTNSAFEFNIGLTGYMQDAETRLYFARSRSYSPALGHFIGRDLVIRSEINASIINTAWEHPVLIMGTNHIGGYWDGFLLYRPTFIPSGTDPYGYWFGWAPCDPHSLTVANINCIRRAPKEVAIPKIMVKDCNDYYCIIKLKTTYYCEAQCDLVFQHPTGIPGESICYFDCGKWPPLPAIRKVKGACPKTWPVRW